MTEPVVSVESIQRLNAADLVLARALDELRRRVEELEAERDAR